MARLLSFAEALDAHEEPWTVQGVLGGLGLLWGEAGVGKSFLACSVAASVATGRPWLGHRVTEGPVVYVVGEGGAQAVARRLDAALSNIRCCDLDEPPPPLWMVVPGVDMVAGPGELIATVGDVRPGLVIVDTLSRCFVGDENKQEDMGRFVRSLDLLRDVWAGCSVLVIHHANREGMVRGSSVLYGAVDVSLHLKRKFKDGPDWVLVADKLRDRDVTAPVVDFRFGSVTVPGEIDSMGDARTTRVVRATDDFEGEVVRAAAAMLGRESWTYAEWREQLPGRPKELMDRLVVAVVGDPETWGVHEHGPGTFGTRRVHDRDGAGDE